MKDTDKDSEYNFQKNELTGIILSALGFSILVGGTVMISPNFPIFFGTVYKIIEEICDQRELSKFNSKYKIKAALKRLEKRKILSINQVNDKLQVTVLEDGQVEVMKYSIKELLKRKEQKQKWQGKWFIVMFDVPERQRNKRDYLRNLLDFIGFVQYQKSVYVYPYDCIKEVDLMKNIVEGGEYIKYIIADKLEGEDEFKKVFNLS